MMVMVVFQCSKVLLNLESSTRLIIDQLAISKLLLMRATLEEELDSTLEALLRVLVGLQR